MFIPREDIRKIERNLAYYLLRWHNDPLAYFIECLRLTPTHQQAQMLMAFRVHNFVAARSGHGTGKSVGVAGLIHNYLDTHKNPDFNCKVPVTGASSDQLVDILWSEVKWINGKKWDFLGNKYEILTEKMFNKEDPKGWFATLRTARKENPDALQGFHKCLFCLDEGSGIPNEVFDVAAGAMGDPECRGVMTGNPTKKTGYFANVFKKKTKWYTLHFNSENSLSDTEYIIPYINPMGELIELKRRGLQTREWVENMKKDYGEHSNTYKIRVKGEFAEGKADNVIEWQWLKDIFAEERKVVDNKHRKKVMAVDPARSGSDPSGVVIRKGTKGVFAKKWQGCDLVESRLKIELIFKEHPDIDVCYIDTIGLGGGLFDELRHKGYPVRAVDVTKEPPSNKNGDCFKLRDWLWWEGRNFFRTNIVCFPDEEIWHEVQEELSTPTYGFRGRDILVESKDDMKARGISSPNLADAFLMTLLCDSSTPSKFLSEKRKEKKQNKKPVSWKCR